MRTYVIEPFTTKEEKILVANDVRFQRKGKTALFTSKKDFVRAAFNIMLPYLPTEKDFVKGVL
jgi:hypothetical protein